MRLEQEKQEEMRKQNDKKKEEDFEDLLSGKSKKITDDMTLQDIFKQFYSKAKTVEVKNPVNSAMSSLGGFSQKLEKRR